MNKNDKRYIKTEKLIHEVFIKLLASFNYDEITVNQLCNECLISKHAFYSHFENKDALLKRIINDLLSGLIDKYEAYMVTMKELEIEIMQNLTYDYVNENYHIFYVLFFRDDVTNFSERFISYMKKYIFDGTHISMNMNEILSIDYMLHGDMGFLKHWVLYYHCHDLSEIKELANQLLKEAHI